ncbi:MAG TPA: PAS domain S-box protein [Lutibacter sp.]|nr:PAS domain S-box protein [Lutibacter sp.]
MKKQTQIRNTSQRLPISNNLYSINSKDKTSNEIVVSINALLKRKINLDKTYDYVNHQLSTLCGYEDYELIGETYKKIIHTDMPMVLYSVLNKKLSNGLPMQIIEKFKTNNGSFFWLLSQYQSKIDEKGNVAYHVASSVQVSKQAVAIINKLYESLKRIETKTSDDVMSKRYLMGFLENYGHTYNTFIEEILNNLPKNEFKKELQKIIQKRVVSSNAQAKKRMTLKLNSQTKTINRQFQLRKEGA